LNRRNELIENALSLAPDNPEVLIAAAERWMGIIDKFECFELVKTHPDLVKTCEDYYQKLMQINPAPGDHYSSYAFFLHWVMQDYEKVKSLSRVLVDNLNPRTLKKYEIWSTL
jgi:hypothetical protein